MIMVRHLVKHHLYQFLLTMSPLDGHPSDTPIATPDGPRKIF